ncbi:collagen-binding domain-containing protein [Arthrobacter bambusae]|uniref:collagen-binding domain-containing protein n=1 Tax=Arthrobacter bambusae TaxID=1338426 RepID=UPI0027800686|nr:collagen-binding domain-containing protein [Arthrobacter bambusae]MDQ0098792.1 choice-of-anchor A domain-containing protein [Arthrobacter bambusae]
MSVTPASLSVDPLAGADGFTVVTFGDASLANHELEGSLAAGGNIAVTSPNPYNVIHKAVSNGNYTLPVLDGIPVRVVAAGHYDLGAGGFLRVSSGGSTGPATEGRMVFGDTSNAAVMPRGAGVCVQTTAQAGCQSPVAEQSAFTETIQQATNPGAYRVLVTAAGEASLHEWNDTIAAGGPAGATPVTTSPTNDGLTLTLTPGAVNVLSLDAGQLPQGPWVMHFSGAVPSADTPLIINLRVADGSLVRLPTEAAGMYPNGPSDNAFAPFMLWNIDQTPGSAVQLATNGISPGSILAPNSHLTEPATIPGTGEQNKGQIEGQIVAATAVFNNQGELHHYAFTPQLILHTSATTPSSTATVTPSATPTAAVATPTPTPSAHGTTAGPTAPTATPSQPAVVLPTTSAQPTPGITTATPHAEGRSEQLAYTGAGVVPVAAAGAAILALGCAMLLARHHKKTHHHG